MEIINVEQQAVAANGVVTFDSVAVRPSCCMAFRAGSGTIILKGGQQPRRYLVSFEGNVGLPTTDGAATPAANTDFGSASLALSIDGESVESTRMVSTPAALGTLNSISCSAYIDVPCGCCLGVAVENVTGTPVNVANASLLAVRTI